MAHHPSPIVLYIVGTEANDRGRSCEEHHHCGEVLQEDVVVRLRKVHENSYVATVQSEEKKYLT